MDLNYYWKIFRRRLPLVIILAAIGAAIGISVAMTRPLIYESGATLIVEAAQIPGDLATSTVRTSEIEALQIIKQRIISRDVLLDLANRLKIYPPDNGMTADDKVADLRARITFATTGGNRKNATIVRVGFSAPTGRMAAETANELVTLIQQQNVEMRTTVARQTLDFFSQETKRLEQELVGISSKITAFKEKNINALPESLDYRRTQQDTLQQRLARLEQEQTALEDRKQKLISLFNDTGQINLDGSVNGASSAKASPAEKRLADLRSRYSQMSAVLSATNPRLKVLQSQIKAAETEVAAERSAVVAQQGGSSEKETADPNASLFDIQVADLDAQINYITQQRSATETQLAAVTENIEKTPSNSITLGTLERDYKNLQEQYNQAVANKAKAETGSMIESLSRGQRITVVEQAVAPKRPTSPNRPMIAVTGIMGGIAFGLAIIALLEILNSSVRRPQDIRKGLGIEVFATIPYMVTSQERTTRRMATLAIALVIAVGVPGALWYIDQNVHPLQPIFERVLNKVSIGNFI